MANVAIVTGSDSGIGKATAVRLARDGFDLGITWHSDREGAEDTAREVQELGRRAVVTQLDVTDFDEAGEIVEALAEELGGLDVFVNNAGGGESHPFLEFPLEAWRRVLDLNLTGAFVCAQRAAQLMMDARAGGRIINVTSVHEHIPLPNAAAYCAAKGGLGLLTKVMALELGEHGIRVNAVAPGERPALPAERPGHAHEIAAAIAFLASPDARHANGASFVIDGGLSLTAAQFNQEAAES